MYNNITSLENLYTAWNDFKTGKQFKKDVLIFAQYLDINLFNLYESLKNKTYTHSPYIHFKINDPKPRDIHKAIVSDRIVHHLLYNTLYEYFNKKFIHDSYSCRTNKGPYKATTRFKSFYNKVSKNNTKTVWVLKSSLLVLIMKY